MIQLQPANYKIKSSLWIPVIEHSSDHTVRDKWAHGEPIKIENFVKDKVKM